MSAVGDFKLSPEDGIVENWKGYNIYRYTFYEIYYFTFDGIFYSNYRSAEDARNAIDELITIRETDMLNPMDPSMLPWDYYRGWPIFRFSYTFMGGGTGYQYYIYFNGVRYTTDSRGPGIYTPDLHAKIDEILSGLAPPAAGTPTPPEEVETPPTEVDLPWYVSWLEPILTWFQESTSYWWGELTKWVDSIVSSNRERNDLLKDYNERSITNTDVLANAVNGVGEAVSSTLFNGIKGFSDQIGGQFEDVGQNIIDEMTKALSPQSPDPKIKEATEKLLKMYYDRQKEIVDEIHHSPANPEEAPQQANILGAAILGVSLTAEILCAFIDLIHPFKYAHAYDIQKDISDKMIGQTFISDFITMPSRIGLLPQLTHYYNSLYQPNIPNYQDLINMLVKEKITQEEFNQNFRYLGYSDYWAGKIWDAHFSPATFTDFLAAMRRGDSVAVPRADGSTFNYTFGEDESQDIEVIKDLSKLADYDPAYWDFFKTRIYQYPTKREIRYLWETGAITDKAEVKSLLRAEGIVPKYLDAMVEYTTEFQTRSWRTKYLNTLSTGYIKGAIPENELREAVLAAEYTPEVADYIIANADARKRIAESGAVEESSKLLSLGDLKKAYINNLIEPNPLRDELRLRGYSESDISLLIQLLDNEKIYENEGGKKVALTQSELVKAWQYSKITEDRLRIDLMTRGLSVDEINILIETKLAEWEAGGKVSPQGGGG